MKTRKTALINPLNACFSLLRYAAVEARQGSDPRAIFGPGARRAAQSSGDGGATPQSGAHKEHPVQVQVRTPSLPVVPLRFLSLVRSLSGLLLLSPH